MANTFRVKVWYLCRTCGHIKKSARWKGCPKCCCWPHADVARGTKTLTQAKASAFGLNTGEGYYEMAGLDWLARKRVR